MKEKEKIIDWKQKKFSNILSLNIFSLSALVHTFWLLFERSLRDSKKRKISENFNLKLRYVSIQRKYYVTSSDWIPCELKQKKRLVPKRFSLPPKKGLCGREINNLFEWAIEQQFRNIDDDDIFWSVVGKWLSTYSYT